MNELKLNEIILRQISGKASSEDIMLLDNWLKQDAENYKTYDILYNFHQIASTKETLFVPDKEQAWRNIENRITLHQNKKFYTFLKYAAAAAVFFLVGLIANNLWNRNKVNEIARQFSTYIVPAGQKSKIILPDGSKVWLNSGTTLKYSSNYNLDSREVTLDGEAFFEVAKDKSRKFTVYSENTSVEVYGTAFNIKNYAGDKKLELSVKEGKVGFLENGNKISDLSNGDQLKLLKGSLICETGKADINIITAWKNDELVFKATSVKELVKYMERWYGVNITIENGKSVQKKYTFKVKTESLTELLQLINIMTPLRYTINGKDVRIRYL
jgi:transmembrane sensor